MYNFDEIICRKGTSSFKHDFPKWFGKHEDAIPLWVADMDFRIPTPVMEAIQKVADHGIYGYTDEGKDYFRAVAGWFEKRHGYHVEKEWMVKSPGVVFAFSVAIQGLTSSGDAIIIQKPLYPPIGNAIKANNRIIVDNPLVYENGRFTTNYEDFEQKIIENNVKMFILCNPHNPVGRVWSKDELLTMGRICQKHGVIVVSDEIHCDIIFNGHKHLVFSNVCDEFADFSVICTAPSKTFNLAGLQAANTFISNNELRNKFKHAIRSVGYSHLNTMGLAACIAAYEHGGQWLDELMVYLEGNAALVRDYLSKETKIVPVPLEGSYLMWLDFNQYGYTHKELVDRLDRAKVWLSSGTDFGLNGAGFMRVNLTSPRSVLKTGMERVVSTVIS